MLKLRLIVMLAVWLTACRVEAVLVYDNTTTDTLNTLLYSTGPFSEIGDEISLDGTERLAQQASVLFFNNGMGSGMFDSTLRFYNVGSPVGTQIGGDFTVENIMFDVNNFALVDFTLGGLILPDDVIFTLAVDQSSPLDVGLATFSPPTIGSSDDTFFIVNSGGFTQGTFDDPAVPDNFYFSLDATAIPESAPWPLAVVCLVLGAVWRMRCSVTLSFAAQCGARRPIQAEQRGQFLDRL
jgi:hypothetical protein